MPQTQCIALVAAAGSSLRMGRDKLWIPLAGRITLARTLDVFEDSPLVDGIVLVANQERLTDVQELCEHERWKKILTVVCGGVRRQDSVRCGLEAIAQLTYTCRWVIIHDAARPFISQEMLEIGLAKAQFYQAAVAAVPAKDTIKHVQDGLICMTPDRSQLCMVQTPQIFAFSLIYQAHQTQLAQEDMTDDASLIERIGNTVAIFQGSYSNIKITTQEDLLFAEALLKGLFR